jgi:hypothetical protein
LSKLIIPGLGVNESTKSAIITILGQQFPLTAKEIHNRLIKEFGLEIKYQSTHKALIELLDERVLDKEKFSYRLNNVWINKVVDYGKILTEKYLNQHEVTSDLIKKVDSGQTVNLVFNQFLHLGQFLINEFSLKFPNPEHKFSICLWEHCWGIFGLSDKEHENLKTLFNKTKHYSVSKQNLFLDKWFNRYLTEMNKIAIGGINFSMPTDTFVQGDYLMQVFLPSELKKNMQEIFEKTNSLNDTAVKEYYDKVLLLKTKIHVIIMKNPELAEGYRNECMKIIEEMKNA